MSHIKLTLPAVPFMDMLAYGSVDPEQAQANAAFIAHARTDIPTLLALIDTLSAENAKLRAALEPFAKAGAAYAEAEKKRQRQHADEGRDPGPAHPDSHRVSVALGDLRTAARALAPAAGEEK